jgi:hypothetical protein
MEKVSSITERIEDKKRRHEILRFRNVLRTVQRTVQCSSCSLKCCMCGAPMESAGPPVPERAGISREFHLCEGCGAEFEDYLDLVQGGKASGLFWHNREWIRLWSSWMEYQTAIGEFRNTPEFRRLQGEKAD